MSDTNEEQLLSDLLTTIAREDAWLDAAHLEARVIDACAAGTTVRLKPDPAYFRLAVAAAVAVAAIVPAMSWLTPQSHDTTVRLKVDPTEVIVPEREKLATAQSSASASAAPRRGTRTNLTNPTNPTNLTNLTNLTNRTRPTTPPSVDEFVPLMPMTEQELAGPFQLVRVQMPRAALGTLRSPLELPNELVEADVLLGEDGMARAIRVSTSGALYPWRSR